MKLKIFAILILSIFALQSALPSAALADKSKPKAVKVDKRLVRAAAEQGSHFSELQLQSLLGTSALIKTLKKIQKKRVFPTVLYRRWLRMLLRGKKNPKLAVRYMQRDLYGYWRKRGIRTPWIKAHQNSYFTFILGPLIKQYQTTLFVNKSSKDSEIKRAYAKALKKIISRVPTLQRLVRNEAQFLEKNGRDSESYKKLAISLKPIIEQAENRNLYHERLALMIQRKGYDPKVIQLLRKALVSKSDLKKWDSVLGLWQPSKGYWGSHRSYVTNLHYALSLHEDWLDQFYRHVKDRGVLENYFEDGFIRSGIFFLDKFINTEPNAHTNSKEIKKAWKKVAYWRGKAKEYGAPPIIIRALLNREARSNAKAGQLLEEDRSQVKWAYAAAISWPALYLAVAASAAAAVKMGISKAAATALFVGLPLGVGMTKGILHFVYRGMKDPRHYKASNFFNELIPELSYALPWSLLGPMMGWGVAAKAPGLAKPLFYSLMALGAGSATYQGVKGYEYVQKGHVEEGHILLIDSAVNMAALLGLVAYVKGVPFRKGPPPVAPRTPTPPSGPGGINPPPSGMGEGPGGVVVPPRLVMTPRIARSGGGTKTGPQASSTQALVKTVPQVRSGIAPHNPSMTPAELSWAFNNSPKPQIPFLSLSDFVKKSFIWSGFPPKKRKKARVFVHKMTENERRAIFQITIRDGRGGELTYFVYAPKGTSTYQVRRAVRQSMRRAPRVGGATASPKAAFGGSESGGSTGGFGSFDDDPQWLQKKNRKDFALPELDISKIERLDELALIYALIIQLSVEMWEHRAEAAEMLGDLRASFAVDALIKALSDESPTVVYKAIEALGKIKDSKSVPHLVAEFFKGGGNLEASIPRVAASKALLGMGKTSLPGLRQALKGRISSYAHFVISELISRIEYRFQTPTKQLMSDVSDPKTNFTNRIDALWALGYRQELKAVDIIIPWLKDENFSIDAENALKTIGVKNENRPHVIKKLRELMMTETNKDALFLTRGILKDLYLRRSMPRELLVSLMRSGSNELNPSEIDKVIKQALQGEEGAIDPILRIISGVYVPSVTTEIEPKLVLFLIDVIERVSEICDEGHRKTLLAMLEHLVVLSERSVGDPYPQISDRIKVLHRHVKRVDEARNRLGSPQVKLPSVEMLKSSDPKVREKAFEDLFSHIKYYVEIIEAEDSKADKATEHLQRIITREVMDLLLAGIKDRNVNVAKISLEILERIPVALMHEKVPQLIQHLMWMYRSGDIELIADQSASFLTVLENKALVPSLLGVLFEVNGKRLEVVKEDLNYLVYLEKVTDALLSSLEKKHDDPRSDAIVSLLEKAKAKAIRLQKKDLQRFIEGLIQKLKDKS